MSRTTISGSVFGASRCGLAAPRAVCSRRGGSSRRSSLPLKEYVAVERVPVSFGLRRPTPQQGTVGRSRSVTAATRDRLVRISVLQEAALQSFQAFASGPHAVAATLFKPCLHSCHRGRAADELLDGTSNPPPTHDEWFKVSNGTPIRLQGLMDERRRVQLIGIAEFPR